MFIFTTGILYTVVSSTYPFPWQCCIISDLVRRFLRKEVVFRLPKTLIRSTLEGLLSNMVRTLYSLLYLNGILVNTYSGMKLILTLAACRLVDRQIMCFNAVKCTFLKRINIFLI